MWTLWTKRTKPDYQSDRKEEVTMTLRERLIRLFDRDVHVSLETGKMQRKRFRRGFRKYRYNPITEELWRTSS